MAAALTVYLSLLTSQPGKTAEQTINGVLTGSGVPRTHPASSTQPVPQGHERQAEESARWGDGGRGEKRTHPPTPFLWLSLSLPYQSSHSCFGTPTHTHTHTHTHRIAAYFDFRKNTASYTLTQAAQLRILLL